MFPTYWLTSNIAFGCVLVLVLLLFVFKDAKVFGSQGYSGYGWLAVLLFTFALAAVLSVNGIVANLIAVFRPHHRALSGVLATAMVLLLAVAGWLISGLFRSS